MDNNICFILKGNIIYSNKDKTLNINENSFLVCNSGISEGVYKNFYDIPKEFQDFKFLDYTDKLIIPGMVDLHIHAPQFNFRGTGMDLELLPWLNNYTFPEESKFKDLEYAKKSYTFFTDALKKSATTRASIFATMHREATELLMDLLEDSGLITYVGKINMDRESIKELMDKDCMDSAYNTFGIINYANEKFKRTYPILTPRFIPSCSDELLSELKEIVHTYNIPIQSHLSENEDEIAWVKELCPDSKFYGDAYEKYDLFGSVSKTIMAHCIYSPPEEKALLKKNGVFVAHCPASNMNLCSGIAPIREYLDMDMNIGLGTDVAGGESESMFRAIVQAIQVSKLYFRLIDKSKKPLSFSESFYLATLGGGKFFGYVGSFEKGYEFDAVIIDDRTEPLSYEMTLEERLERSIYLSLDLTSIIGKFVKGTKII